jgi:hypothetical protein
MQSRTAYNTRATLRLELVKYHNKRKIISDQNGLMCIALQIASVAWIVTVDRADFDVQGNPERILRFQK